MTQADLAEAAGLSTQAVSALERGVRAAPRRDTVLSIAAALHLTDIEQDQLFAVSRSRPRSQRRSDEPSSVPQTLPRAVSDFTGRSDAQEAVRQGVLGDREGIAGRIVAISGMGGVGKTALALQVSHQLADEFPDGQIYLDLGGFSMGETVSSREALARIITAFGASTADLSSDLALLTAQYRSMIAGRRVLLVLDNAADARQVRQLLPGTPMSAVIVTSRRTLSTLAGATLCQLDTFTVDEGVELVTAAVGQRVREEPDAARELVEQCGRLPLAIRIVAARLAARPFWPISQVSNRLARDGRQLDEIEHQDLSLRRTLGLSLAELSESEQELDRRAAAVLPRLTLLPGESFVALTAAAWLDLSERTTEDLLEHLVDNGLLQSPQVGQYQFHDLIRLVGSEAALPSSTADRAIGRVLDLYCAIGWHSSALLFRNDERGIWELARPATELAVPGDLTETASWLVQEAHNIVAVAKQSARLPGCGTQVSQLAISLMPLYMNEGRYHELLSLNQIARAVAEEQGDQVAAGLAQHDAAVALAELTRTDEATDLLHEAIRSFETAEDPCGQTMALRNLCAVSELAGRLEDGIAAGHRSLQLADRIGWHVRDAQTHMLLGLLYGRLGETERELEHFEKSLASVGTQKARLPFLLKHIGVAHRTAGRLDLSINTLRASIESSREHGNATAETTAVIELARAYLEHGDLPLATATIKTGINLADSLGIRTLQARCLYALGNIHAKAQDPAAARTAWLDALKIYEELDAPEPLAQLRRLLDQSN